MPSPEVHASPEWALLEAIALGDTARDTARDTDPGPAGAATTSDDRSIDIDELVSQAMRHAMIPALAEFLLGHDLFARVDPCVRVHLASSLQWNRHRSRSLAIEAIRVVDALQVAGIRVACTKGVICQATLYDSRGIRFFSDVDLMIRPEDAQATTRVLDRLGYSNERRYDLQRDELVEVPREVRLVYKRYPDHLEPFFRVTGDSADPVFKLDFAFSLTWYRSRWQVPMEDALRELDQVTVVPGARDVLPSLNVGYGFLFVALHVFRDAWFHAAVLDKDVRLMQLADVARFWGRLARPQAASIADLIVRHDLGPAVAWVSHHVDSLFGTSIVDDLGLGAYTDEAWLCSASASDGTYLAWDGDMRRRLWLRGTPDFVPCPEPPFAASARSLPDPAALR